MAELDLSKVAERDTIKLPGGKVRQVIRHTDLGVYELAYLNLLQQKVGKADRELRGSKTVTPAKEKKVLDLLGDVLKILIPGITPGELGQLSRGNREQIVWWWIAQNSDEPQGEKSGEARRPRRNGAGSSRASKRSTGATRSSGSTTRRG